MRRGKFRSSSSQAPRQRFLWTHPRSIAICLTMQAVNFWVHYHCWLLSYFTALWCSVVFVATRPYSFRCVASQQHAWRWALDGTKISFCISDRTLCSFSEPAAVGTLRCRSASDVGVSTTDDNRRSTASKPNDILLHGQHRLQSFSLHAGMSRIMWLTLDPFHNYTWDYASLSHDELGGDARGDVRKLSEMFQLTSMPSWAFSETTEHGRSLCSIHCEFHSIYDGESWCNNFLL